MSPFVGLAISLVPELLKLIGGQSPGGLISGALGEKIGEIVKGTTQASTPEEAAKKIVEDPAIRAQLQIRLAEVALDAQRAELQDAENQRTFLLKQRQLDADILAKSDDSAMASTAAARTLTKELAGQNPLLALTPAVLSYIVVCGFLIMLLMMALGFVNAYQKVDESILQIFNVLIGALAAAFATVINFWLGSSLGSSRKDTVLESKSIADSQERKEFIDKIRTPPPSRQSPPEAPPETPPESPGPAPAPVPSTSTPSGTRLGSDPVVPAARSVLTEVIPDLMKPHRQFADGVSWELTGRGISIEGAPARGTPGTPSTVRDIWRNYGKFCAEAARKYGVPVELIISTIATESRGKHDARRAEPQINDESVGLMQTLVKTARGALSRPSLRADDLLDPNTSINAGTAYIAQQRSTTRFDPPLVAASYNAGSIRRDAGEANRWRLRCFPIGTGRHVDTFVSWFADAMRVSAEDNWGADGTPSFASEFKGTFQQGQLPADFPARPTFSPLVSLADRQGVFGTFQFEPAPVAGNKEAIRILGGWAKDNIVRVSIPVKELLGKPGSFEMDFNRKAAEQIRGLFLEWEQAGLLGRIKTFDGSFVPRFIRDSKTTLSNHAFGSAFDINARWNPLRAEPALMGEEGCVRELVPIAHKWGFYWGGHFKDRPDGMHFEIAKIL